jgi:GNAT superfamily N-acetyltransferase
MLAENTFQIRPATREDSAAIARLQVDSYRTTYAGILPQDYLAHFTYEEQEQDWRDWLLTHPRDILYLAETGQGESAGYALARPGLTDIPAYDSELMALHVRRSYQRQGLGRRLVKAVVELLRQQGCASLLVWVLAENPYRQFYERLGGQLIGEKALDFVPAVEVAYGWPDIRTVESARGRAVKDMKQP